jgi:hypothetical protein
MTRMFWSAALLRRFSIAGESPRINRIKRIADIVKVRRFDSGNYVFAFA